MQRKAYKITRFSRKKKIKRGEKEEFGGKKEAHTEVLQLARTGRWFSLPSTGVSAFHWDTRGVPTRGRSWGRKRRLCPHTLAPAAGAPLSGRLLLSRSEVQTTLATLGAHLESLRWSSPPLPPQI